MPNTNEWANPVVVQLRCCALKSLSIASTPSEPKSNDASERTTTGRTNGKPATSSRHIWNTQTAQVDAYFVIESILILNERHHIGQLEIIYQIQLAKSGYTAIRTEARGAQAKDPRPAINLKYIISPIHHFGCCFRANANRNMLRI